MAYMSEHRFTNALAKETSPYLLQHAHNPVYWYPWGKEALAKARAEDKPILLSIGYSACHWCHVMERESFENEEIAQLMNENFINIKVDREERPDIDAIYMAAVQMMIGRGGWPMTMFLTPDQVPFYGGTYFPPEDRHGMPGFRRVLMSVAATYREKKSAIYEQSAKIISELQKENSFPGTQSEVKDEILYTAASSMVASYDPRNGGFGQAPKFPPSMTLTFLMRSYQQTGKEQYLEVVHHTLDKMGCGGIYDQLGGGFHRYSVDDYWLVPHFEKMLYDNALLSRAYLDAYLLTKNDFFRQISQETLDYIKREMTSAEGGFFSSQDADSEGQEGRFFIWSLNEVESLLGKEEAELFCPYFGITAEGNFEGKNILHVPRSAALVAQLNNVSEERLREVIQRGKKLLFAAREKRIKPARDEKMLTAWNGLMLRSFAEAANSLDREDYRQVAIQNAKFVLSKLYHEGQLFRSYKDGQARFSAYLDDYACLIDGLLSLYEATFDEHWIQQALHLSEFMIQNFWDPQCGGFYFTANNHETLIHRPKEFFDHATPCGNSVAAYALLRLEKLTGEEKWAYYSISLFEGLVHLMSSHPSAFSHLLCALDFHLSRPKEIAVIGDPGSTKTRELLKEVFTIYLPNKVVACGLNCGLFLLQGRPQVNGMPTAYICENFSCRSPVTTAKDLTAELKVNPKM